MKTKGIMNVVGYVRHSPGRSDPDSAFAQSERIRRWAADTSSQLISVCQDHQSSSPTERPGFKALLDIVRSNSADAVVIANLVALSPDIMTQEIMIQDLRDAGVTVIATDEADVETLQNSAENHARMLVRDVVARVAEHQRAFGTSLTEAAAVAASEPEREETGPTEVVVKLRGTGA